MVLYLNTEANVPTNSDYKMPSSDLHKTQEKEKKLQQSHLKAMVVFSHKLDCQFCLSKLVQEVISLSKKFPTKHTPLTGHNIFPFTHQYYLVIFRNVPKQLANLLACCTPAGKFIYYLPYLKPQK